MKERFRVMVHQVIVVPIEVEADTTEEAAELALASRGIAADSWYGNTTVESVTKLEE